MILLFEELLGAETGNAADADPTRRYAVRLATAADNSDLTDPLTGALITEITWSAVDALPFEFYLSAQTKNGYKAHVSVGRSNIGWRTTVSLGEMKRSARRRNRTCSFCQRWIATAVCRQSVSRFCHVFGRALRKRR